MVVTSAYRASYVEQLIGQVALTSFKRRSRRDIGAYSLNNFRLG